MVPTSEGPLVCRSNGSFSAQLSKEVFTSQMNVKSSPDGSEFPVSALESVPTTASWLKLATASFLALF